MELLLRWLTPRGLLLVIAVLAAAAALPHLVDYPRAAYLRWRYPPQGGTDPRGAEIMADLERRESLRVKARYDRLMARLQAAKAQGFEVGPIERKAEAALRLNTPQYRRLAVKTLAELEMAVPRKPTRYIPLHPADGEDDVPDDARGRPAGRRTRR